MINRISNVNNYSAYQRANKKNDTNAQTATPAFQGKSKLIYAIPVTASLILATITGCAVHKNDTKPVEIVENTEKPKIDLNENIAELINIDNNKFAKDLRAFNKLDVSEKGDITTINGSLFEQDFALNIEKSDNGVLIGGNIDKENYDLSINRSEETIKGSMLGKNINCKYFEDNEDLLIVGKYGDKDINVKLVNEKNRLKIKNLDDKTICSIGQKDGKLDLLYDEKADTMYTGGVLGIGFLCILGLLVKYKMDCKQDAKMYALKCALSDLSARTNNKRY